MKNKRESKDSLLAIFYVRNTKETGTMKTERFLKIMTEQIKEAQLKLGFAREVIRLYFPASSLSLLLQVKCETGEELLKLLEEEAAFSDTVLGKIRFSLCKDDRIEVCIGAKGAEYVHSQIADPPFLKGLVQLFGENHHLTIEEISDYFSRFNEQYICEKMEPGTDFDYVLYFPEQKPDEWYYCIRMEMGHTIYHRFMKDDYDQLVD